MAPLNWPRVVRYRLLGSAYRGGSPRKQGIWTFPEELVAGHELDKDRVNSQLLMDHSRATPRNNSSFIRYNRNSVRALSHIMSMLSKVRHLRQQITRGIKRQPNAYLSQAASDSTTHNINEPIEEEQLPGDRLEHFHPTSPRQVLDGRFKTVTKLGFGAGSTFWLAENLQ